MRLVRPDGAWKTGDTCWAGGACWTEGTVSRLVRLAGAVKTDAAC